MGQSYDLRWVALAVFVAVVLAALCVEFVSRDSVAGGRRRTLWIAFAGVALSGCLAAAHYVGTGPLGLTMIVLVLAPSMAIVFHQIFTQQAIALKSIAQQSHAIVESAVDAFLEIDSDGRITDWNSPAERIFGWPRAQAIGEPVDKMFVLGGFPEAEALNQLLDRRETGSAGQRLEVTARHRSGRLFPAEMTISMFRHRQQTLFAAFVHDVSERKLVETEREAAKIAAEGGSRAKSEFLANMSHEIRTPMNGVIGMTELLLETVLDSTQRDYAEAIRDSGAALLTIINDILDFSKVEAGKLELEHIDMDLRDTVEDVARLLSLQAHAKGLEITAQIDPRVPDLVKGDAGRIRQVLLNLAGNAVKFTQRGEVSLELKVLDQNAEGTSVRCEVRDTGIGIPADRLTTLFDAFTQVDASTTRQFGGTGLGLSIVKRLVELMGGQSGVESVAGRGSTFWFTARFAAAECARETRYAAPPLSGQRVLVVDDNATNRKVLMGQLSLCGVEPMAASSANEAIEILRHACAAGRAFDAALLDHQMPDCDGAQLGTIINQDSLLSTTRLVLLTSSGQRGDSQMFASIGFAGYLLKPVTQRDLTECLMLVLARTADVWHMRSQPIVTRDALRSQRSRAKNRLLLAEDNALNQKVARRILEKLSFRVDLVSDGRQAVDAWRAGGYDLILMDCQMPVLDGYGATREIRSLELDGTRIPIVALTAHAMKGDDEKCRAAGMDDYLTKPIDRARLEQCLEHYLPSTAVAEAAQNSTQAASAAPVDWPALLQSVDGDETFARELVGVFISSGDEALARIAAALNINDYDALHASAHSLKGASANLQAAPTRAAASLLEFACDADRAQVPVLADKLSSEVRRAIDYLQTKVA